MFISNRKKKVIRKEGYGAGYSINMLITPALKKLR
jgi:hypothetical protein